MFGRSQKSVAFMWGDAEWEGEGRSILETLEMFCTLDLIGGYIHRCV